MTADVVDLDLLANRIVNEARAAAPDLLVARVLDGAAAILDMPESTPAVWGEGDQVLWPEGESLMLAGPPGVGKTTLTGRVLRGLLGLDATVLGLPVRPIGSRVLYLAMDRPAQIRRSLRRQFADDDRSALHDRLALWQGPPPGDLADDSTLLLRMARANGADTVVIDSLKDAVVGLTDDKIAAAYNRSRQEALAAGMQVMELHHQTKRGPNGTKPDDLAAVYGSMHLTSGAGSVVLLWGAAGDPIVELRHLKQPAGDVGPLRLLLTAEGGASVHHGTDLVALARECRDGMTVDMAAANLYPPTGKRIRPTDSEIERARRKLRSLVTTGHLREESGGPRKPARWHAIGGPIDPIQLAVDVP